MAETGTMRVVPSGKIYRQMFEAQVQLNRSLTKVTRDSAAVKPGGRGATVPIVHLSKDDIEHGILGERQRTWADGFPNDPYVDNPVVYKQYADYVNTQMRETESSIAGKEVRGLPDTIVPPKESSNIIERIEASRKERHEAAVEEMQQELSVISSEMEPRIAEICSNLIGRLEENDKEIAALMARIQNDEDLLTYTVEGLDLLWQEIESHSVVRQDWIIQCDNDLKRAEDDRMQMVQSVFKDYAKMLEKIAYILAPDLHRFMDKESQVINQTVLSNRRAYGDLYVRLMSTDIEREKTQHTWWKRRADDWKMLKTELAIKRFKTYMEDDKIVSPVGVQKVLQFMMAEQELLNAKRTELIKQLSDLKPPSSTKTSVYHWNKGVQNITTEIDTSNQLHLSSLHKEYENVCQSCLDEIDEIKNDLVDTGVCSVTKAKTVVEEFMIPLVGDRQRIYEQTLDNMEKALEQHNKKSTEELKALFKYAQGAAHVWDVHEIGLARQERALQEKLEQSRQQHDNQNQDKEAHLDIIMDRMRQDASEKALKDSLTRALEMLEKIRLSYEVFHKEQTQIVKQYPEMVRQELLNYDKAVCKLFMVNRNQPDEVGEEEEDLSEGENLTALTEEPTTSDEDATLPGQSEPRMSTNEPALSKPFQSQQGPTGANSSALARQPEPTMASNSASSQQSVPRKQGSAGANNSALSRLPVRKKQGPTGGNNAALSRLPMRKKQGSTRDNNTALSRLSVRKELRSTGANNAALSRLPLRKEQGPTGANDSAMSRLPVWKKQGPTGGDNSALSRLPVRNEQGSTGASNSALSRLPVRKEQGSTGASNSALSRLPVQNKQGSNWASNSALSRLPVWNKQGSTGTNNSALNRQPVPSQQGAKQWQRVRLTSITESEATDSSGSETTKRHVRCIEDMMKNSHKGASTPTERISQDIARLTPLGLGGDRYRSDISVVESGLTVGSCNTDTDLAVLYAELQELEDEGIEDIEEIKETLDEYLGLGEPDRQAKKTPVKPKLTKDAAKDLPTAVSEILSTAKGTTFYVLTTAAALVSPVDKSKGQGKGSGGGAFLTEVSITEEKPAYLKNIELPQSLLKDIKNRIRLNFLDHLEDWTEQAAERAASVVVAKCEEMNSELDLRLHLHKPRARRAEYDVHNVRAAELVMHSERVTRHCKGILQALTDVRTKFTNMTGEHNKLAAKFREDIEALEVVFINATKAAKLYGLKNQLNVELDKFMSVIRASLRQYRQHLDETLQMLRESNARFIKSFKVFSDGGNFCPEEIEEYRKRLDKMATKIDQSEGSIMSDLEGMESKRLDQATKVAVEFEDRFKSHMFDLIFMEKIARWLTNTQVKIKAEVADSNSQAQKLAQHLNDLERRIDACERPNLDKEQITSDQLNDTLKGIFEAFHARSAYLNCLKDPTVMRPPSGTGTMQGAPAVGARVGFAQDQGPTPISKAGKMPAEDPSVGVIKNIMKSQKTKLRFGMDAELDGEYAPKKVPKRKRKRKMTIVEVEEKVDGYNYASILIEFLAKQEAEANEEAGGTDMREKMKSSMSTNASSERGKVSRRGQSSPGLTSTDGNARKAQSAAHSGSSSKGEWARKSSKPAKFERKVLIFGDVTSEEEEQSADTHFLGIIRKVLREALDGLLSASEMYYRQKGARPVTRPQALQETYEQCAEVISQKLQSYYQQVDDYHNQCLQEFRSQLTQLEKQTPHIPSLVTKDLVKDHITQSQTSHTSHESQFKNTQLELEKKREEHKHLLRPSLGHPHQVNQLTSLCEAETERHNEFMAAVEKQAETLQTCAADNAKEFLDSVARLSENQLLQYDNMLVVDDVVKGRVEPKKYPTSELIRRRNAGEPLEDDEDKNALPRGKGVWEGLPSNEMVIGEKSNKQQLTASVTTAKTTLAHNAVVKARDEAYQEYKKQYENTLANIAEEKEKLLVAEQRWMDSWNTSVEKVKQLY